MQRTQQGRWWTWAALAAAVLALTAAGCGGSRQADGSWGISSVQVSVGLYSGRSDPSRTLTVAEAASLDGRLGALTQRTGTPPAGGLGYHGFTIVHRSPEGVDTGIMVAYRGTIAPPGEGPRFYRVDDARSIERYLLTLARPSLTADEAAAVQRDLDTP